MFLFTVYQLIQSFGENVHLQFFFTYYTELKIVLTNIPENSKLVFVCTNKHLSKNSHYHFFYCPLTAYESNTASQLSQNQHSQKSDIFFIIPFKMFNVQHVSVFRFKNESLPITQNFNVYFAIATVVWMQSSAETGHEMKLERFDGLIAAVVFFYVSHMNRFCVK